MKANAKEISGVWTHWDIALIVLLGVCICIIKSYTFNEAYERDITSHAVIAHEMLQGRALYGELWDSKPPGIFATYGVFERLFGYGPLQIYCLNCVAAIITLIGIYRFGTVFGGRNAGLWAAGYWVLICNDLWLEANQPNIEACINACLAWGLALVFGAGTASMQLVRWTAVGLLMATATLYKPVAVTFAVIPCLGYLMINFKDRQARKIALLQVGTAGFTAVLAWGAVYGYFALTGRAGIFYDTIVTYGRYYAGTRDGSVALNILEGFSLTRLFPVASVKTALVLWAVSLTGMAVGIVRGKNSKWLLMAMVFLSAHIAVSLPGRFYPHYYQLWFVPLTVGAGCTASSVLELWPSLPSRMGWITGVVILAVMFMVVAPQYSIPSDRWSYAKQGPQYDLTRAISRELDRLLEKDETMYVWGINPSFYFWTKRRVPTGVIWATDMMDNPLAESLTRRALGDLKAESPEMIIINLQHIATPESHPVLQWIMENYVPLPGRPLIGKLKNNPFFYVLASKQGSLIKRLSQ
ncbi:MAG: glycosyltransferase family 39 protein [Pseudomonadota bacterium]